MNIPVEVVAECSAVLLTALIGLMVFFFKKIERLERTVLTIVIMLESGGFKIPDGSDTDRLLKTKL